jgi:hypothetical protein
LRNRLNITVTACTKRDMTCSGIVSHLCCEIETQKKRPHILPLFSIFQSKNFLVVLQRDHAGKT